MKKIFSFLCAALMVLSASATTGVKSSYLQAKTADANLLPVMKTEAMAPIHSVVAAVGTNFTMTADNITHNSAKIFVTPADLTAPFYASYMTAAEYASTNEAALAQELKEDMDIYIALYQYYGQTKTYADFTHTGLGVLTASDLEEETEYVAYAYNLNLTTGLAASAFDTVHFTTTALQIDTITLTFLPYYDEDGYAAWDDYVASEGWWQYQGINEDENIYVSLSNIYTTQVAGTYTTDDMDPDFTAIYDFETETMYAFLSISVVVTENNGVVSITAEGLCENGHYYIMTCITTDTSTALENVEAAKAQKVIENGQVIIIRDGKRFNLMGAEL